MKIKDSYIFFFKLNAFLTSRPTEVLIFQISKIICYIYSVIQVLKAVVAQFDASELITQRELVSQKVNEDLTERAKRFGVILDDISIVSLYKV